jgi:hypothetical protein
MKTAPIGIETQLENILFGISETEKTETENKIFLVSEHVSEIVKINGKKVFNVIVDGDNLCYDLSKYHRAEADNYRVYYYPIKYADIEFKTN